MSVERKIYKVPFRKGHPPEWTCPQCGRGILEGIAGTFHHEESRPSKDAHSDEDWEPEWINYVYSCSFRCTNPQCLEIVTNVGTGSVDWEPDYDETYDEPGNPVGLNYYDYFQPKYFQPHLNIFKVPKNTPENIRTAIFNSFELFFSSYSSSSNHIRIALELILDYLKIKKYENRKGKRIIINLHRRIELIPSGQNELKELLFAIKWLGNTGSHSQDISMDDVMDAYDILEDVLYELFEKRSKLIKKLAKQINKKKGPKNNKVKKL